MDSKIEARIAAKLQRLYGDVELLEPLRQMLAANPIPPRPGTLSERDALIIAYGDHVQHNSEAPLQTLHTFASTYLKDLISGIHILPFYPYTSDDGFSVVDYQTVNPELGSWGLIKSLGADFRLMFDLVLNHVSVSSAWFQGFLRDEPPYRDYFITADPVEDWSQVVRPRTHPVLTPFETAAGVRHVWTTFSTDQVDLNYENPAVLLAMLETLLIYVREGADFIRLDAIAYLWKTRQTACIHLPQTHTVVQLFRDVLDAAAPWVKLITETNVPHVENLSYFGDGRNEAQLVYQFALPPLLLHTFYTGDARKLSAWASELKTPSEATSFFNFTASHDGIGLRPLTGLVAEAAIQTIADTVLERGGQISYKMNPDGNHSPYELNITYFDALAVPGEALARSVDRFMASQAVMLALAGLPGIYLPSLFGAGNWAAGVIQTGRTRTINREKFDFAGLAGVLNDPNTRQAQVFQLYRHLLRRRRTEAAFHPGTPQQVLDIHPAVFALKRGELLALHNMSNTPISIDLPSGQWHDLISDRNYQQQTNLSPYQSVWLVPGERREHRTPA
ncbi:MAG TPA: sugar phosphorylase [Phototrophicaceae bacterium]|nr:sugar phosphorylase [Phototrophicaceae bacterium]